MSVNHSLRYNGAAFNADGDLINADTKVTSGSGRAACSCGVLSDKLTTGAARRNWFKAHKEEAAAAVLAELDALVADAEPDTHDEPVATHRDPEATPHLLSLREGSTPDEDEFLLAVPFTEKVAKHFWRPLARVGSKALVDIVFPSLSLTSDDKALVTVFEGPETDVRAAAAALEEMYDEASEAFYAWKREDEGYLALDHTSVEARRESYQMTKRFFNHFATQFAGGLLDDEDLI